MEKMTKYEAVLRAAVSELNEIKCHIANQRHFEGGVSLGALMHCLCVKIDELPEKKEEEEQEGNHICDRCGESCEEENEEDEEDEHNLCRDCQEVDERVEIEMQMQEFRQQHQIDTRRILELETLIKDLIKRDHIYASSLDEAIKRVKRPEESIESLYNLLPGKQMRPLL